MNGHNGDEAVAEIEVSVCAYVIWWSIYYDDASKGVLLSSLYGSVMLNIVY